MPVGKGTLRWLDCYNGKPGEPTVLRFYLPGHTFDGTSCFNLAKESIARYYGERIGVRYGEPLLSEAALPIGPERLASELL